MDLSFTPSFLIFLFTFLGFWPLSASLSFGLLLRRPPSTSQMDFLMENAFPFFMLNEFGLRGDSLLLLLFFCEGMSSCSLVIS